MFSGIGQRYIKGIGKLGEKLLVILDLGKLFTEEEDGEKTKLENVDSNS